MTDSVAAKARADDERGRGGSARLLHPVDLGVALAILAFCALALWQTTHFDQVSFMLSQNVPPELFPQILIVMIAIMAALLPFEHILLRRKGKDIDKDRREPVKRLSWLTMGLLVAVSAASPLFGTALTMVTVCLLLPLLWGERRLHIVLPFALAFPAGVTVLFNYVLGVYFEPGVLGIQFY